MPLSQKRAEKRILSFVRKTFNGLKLVGLEEPSKQQTVVESTYYSIHPFHCHSYTQFIYTDGLVGVV